MFRKEKIKIVVNDGNVMSFKIKTAKRQITTKYIQHLLTTMPKDHLAEALGIKEEGDELVDVKQIEPAH